MQSKPTQKITRTYSEVFKLQVIEQIEQGRYNANQEAQLYGCCPSSIHGLKNNLQFAVINTPHQGWVADISNLRTGTDFATWRLLVVCTSIWA